MSRYSFILLAEVYKNCKFEVMRVWCALNMESMIPKCVCCCCHVASVCVARIVMSSTPSALESLANEYSTHTAHARWICLIDDAIFITFSKYMHRHEAHTTHTHTHALYRAIWALGFGHRVPHFISVFVVLLFMTFNVCDGGSGDGDRLLRQQNIFA